MKVIFMGTPEFAVPTLEKLIENHEVVAVVTQPDKPKGRGNKVLFPPVKEKAVEHNIQVLQPEKIRQADFVEKLRAYNADVFIVVAYGQILPESILNMPQYGCINVHGSLLPKYRGAAPIQWAVVDGEAITGVTIMYMAKGIDTGDMILKREIPILPEDTGSSLHDKMSVIGADALIEALDLVEKNQVAREKQDDSLSCYAKMLTKEMGNIDFKNSSAQIINLIRGLNPWPTAYTFYNSDMLKIWKAEKYDFESKGEIGQIIKVIKDGGLVVKTGDGCILITEIQAKNSKRMKVSDYLRGHQMDEGIILVQEAIL